MSTLLPWRTSDFDAALVDLDGTMVDTLDDFVIALHGMLAELPAPYSQHTTNRQETELMVGKGSENLVNSLLNLIDNKHASSADAALRSKALERYLVHYGQANGKHAQVYAGVKQGLDAFKALGWKLGCVTNKPTAYAKDLLKAMGLADYFALVIGGDATARKKPDPMPLLVACETLGVATGRTLMVGDSSNDAKAAKAAGCPVLLVTYGYNHGEDIADAGADALTDSLAGLQWRD
jgi:phosphoglycolate phosphatase